MNESSEAKVAYLNVVVLVQQHVLQLDIPMHDAATVQIVDAFADLTEESRGGDF